MAVGPDFGVLYDPALDAHVAECRSFNARLAKFAGERPDYTTAEGLAKMRDLTQVAGGLYATEPLDDRARTRCIEGRAGDLALRVIEPQSQPRAVYLDLHGGGFFMGDARMGDRVNCHLADSLGVVTVGVDYRLAPEHPYPAAPDDCEVAALWVLESARREWGVDTLLIGGGSAGGNLVVVTLLRLRDRHNLGHAFTAANLVFGVYDLRGTASQIRLGQTAFRDLYLPHIPIGARTDPDISPMYADLTGLPPALFTVGTLDYLYDDSLMLAIRWWAAGSPAELAVYPECPHGFTVFPTAMARAANDRITNWLGSFLSDAPRNLHPNPT